MSLTPLQFRIMYILASGHPDHVSYFCHQRTLRALEAAGYIASLAPPIRATVKGYRHILFEAVNLQEEDVLTDTNPLFWTPSANFLWSQLI